MIENKKVIGFCMTKIQDPPKSRMLGNLNELINQAGYKGIIFNSPLDFGSEEEAVMGAAGVYDFINYDIVDALVIMTSGFMNPAVYEKIIQKAQANHVPVILEDVEYEGCYTVKNQYEKALEELLNFVIRENHITETFFMAGMRNNIYSEGRVEIYKKVLAQNGLEFKESRIDYGDFWAGPTYEAMDRLFARNEKLPQAFFCANDAMAVAVCEKLAQHGIRVPEDVLVTGFDGSRMGDFSEPRIATCAVDSLGFAQKCVKLIGEILNGTASRRIVENYYVVRPAESCGCSSGNNVEFKKMAEEYHRMLVNDIGHEYVTFNKIMRMLNSSQMDSNLFYKIITQLLDESSVLALRPSWFSFMNRSGDVEDWNNDLILLKGSKAGDDQSQMILQAQKMIPEWKKWVQDTSMYVVSAVQVGNQICGYYERKTTNIVADSEMINRILNLINITVHMANIDMKQRFQKIDQADEKVIDSVTEMANLHGITKWFEDFKKIPENRDKQLVITLYQLAKYRYIYENFGIQAVETAVCYVAEALRVTNSRDSFVAHISEEDFLVINYYDASQDVESAMIRSEAVFGSMMDSFNHTNAGEYYVEVASGSTQTCVKDDEKLEQLIQLATNEMYHDRVQYGPSTVKKTEFVNSKERYDVFNMLVSKNMFRYQYQPIVKASNGEIYAYEALMRTDAAIGFGPMDILSIAKEYNRLYDIEKATLFNVMEQYISDYVEFQGRKVFINCIPGHFLNEKDSRKLGAKYTDYIHRFVFEITEQDTITDEELKLIRSIGNSTGDNTIAIDDFGTGHSNIVNLIGYDPEIVKLDRFLMSNIHQDTSKQMLVQSTIHFAKSQGIEVLAEGVETEEELRKVIELGVDYIQGFFTARPSFDPLDKIDERVREIILDANEQR